MHTVVGGPPPATPKVERVVVSLYICNFDNIICLIDTSDAFEQKVAPVPAVEDKKEETLSPSSSTDKKAASSSEVSLREIEYRLLTLISTCVLVIWFPSPYCTFFVRLIPSFISFLLSLLFCWLFFHCSCSIAGKASSRSGCSQESTQTG